MELQLLEPYASIPFRVSHRRRLSQAQFSCTQISSSRSPVVVSHLLLLQFNSPCRSDRRRGSRTWMVKYKCAQLKYEGDGSRISSRHSRRPLWRYELEKGLWIRFVCAPLILESGLMFFSGASLLRKIKAAVPERNEHVHSFRELTESLPNSVSKWRECVEAWERDPTKKNPFEFEGTCECFIIVDCGFSLTSPHSYRRRCSQAQVATTGS
jgi:hypothetical protein